MTEPSYIQAPSNSLNTDEIEIDSDFSEEHSPVLNTARPVVQALDVAAPSLSTHDNQDKSQTATAQISSNTPTLPPKPEIDANAVADTRIPDINATPQTWTQPQQQQGGEENEERHSSSTKEHIAYTAPNGRAFISDELKAYSLGIKIDNKLIYFQPNFIEDDPWTYAAMVKERDDSRYANNGNNNDQADGIGGHGHDPSTQGGRSGLSGDVRNQPGFVDTRRHGGYGAINDSNRGGGSGGKRATSDWWSKGNGGGGKRGAKDRAWRSATGPLRGGESGDDAGAGKEGGEGEGADQAGMQAATDSWKNSAESDATAHTGKGDGDGIAAQGWKDQAAGIEAPGGGW